MHLLYARFWHKVLFDAGVVPTKEPFKKLVHQGMILGEGGQKMSKSRGNVVNPDDIVRDVRGGCDARLRDVHGSARSDEALEHQLDCGRPPVPRPCLHRDDARGRRQSKPDAALTRLLHQTIRKVTDDIEAMRFNTAISAMMVLSNELMKLEQVPIQALEVLARLVHPFAPHLGEEAWQMLGHAPSVQHEAWPDYDPALCEEDEVEIPVQINGKVRARITLPKDATKDQALVLAQQALPSQLEGKPPRKIIWVPNKILNLIV